LAKVEDSDRFMHDVQTAAESEHKQSNQWIFSERNLSEQ